MAVAGHHYFNYCYISRRYNWESAVQLEVTCYSGLVQGLPVVQVEVCSLQLWFY